MPCLARAGNLSSFCKYTLIAWLSPTIPGFGEVAAQRHMIKPVLQRDNLPSWTIGTPFQKIVQISETHNPAFTTKPKPQFEIARLKVGFFRIAGVEFQDESSRRRSSKPNDAARLDVGLHLPLGGVIWCKVIRLPLGNVLHGIRQIKHNPPSPICPKRSRCRR